MTSLNPSELHQWLQEELKNAIVKSAKIHQEEGDEIRFYHALLRHELRFLLLTVLSKLSGKSIDFYKAEFDRFEKEAFGE